MGATGNRRKVIEEPFLQPVIDAPELIAYRVDTAVRLDIVPAHQQRDWIDRLPQQFARRCLPMLMANQAGWLLTTPHRFTATWNGGPNLEDISVEYDDPSTPAGAISHFGYGMLTFNVPYLFRTSPGWNLLARGPANWPKPGIVALEGIVETDWSESTFTMNWQMTAPGVPVTFEAGEPVCMVLPQRRGELEAIRPAIEPIGSDPGLAKRYEAWSASRRHFNAQLKVEGAPEAQAGWQKDYFRGITPAGDRARWHQTKLKLAPFDEPGGYCLPEDDA